MDVLNFVHIPNYKKLLKFKKIKNILKQEIMNVGMAGFVDDDEEERQFWRDMGQY